MLLKRSFYPIRRSPRQWLNTSVRVFAGPAPYEALGVNVSDGGMCLFTIANLPVGTQLDVEFRPPRSSGPVRFSAKVRHRALYLYGIEFLRESCEGEANRRARAAGISCADA